MEVVAIFSCVNCTDNLGTWYSHYDILTNAHFYCRKRERVWRKKSEKFRHILKGTFNYTVLSNYNLIKMYV